jgi:hypothetical protein
MTGRAPVIRRRPSPIAICSMCCDRRSACRHAVVGRADRRRLRSQHRPQARAQHCTEVIYAAPKARELLIANLGDWYHANDQRNVTPKSKHQLDVDGRWFKVLRTGVRLFIDIIEVGLRRHDRVEVVNIPGNHDPEAAASLALALSCFYSRNKRVKIAFPADIYYRQFGATLLGCAHGDKAPPSAWRWRWRSISARPGARPLITGFSMATFTRTRPTPSAMSRSRVFRRRRQGLACVRRRLALGAIAATDHVAQKARAARPRDPQHPAAARVSYLGNAKHNPGEPMHHARGKSMDHPDCILRHLLERGGVDVVMIDGIEHEIKHTGALAWRALALLQEEIEREQGLPLPRAAKEG